VPTQLSSSNPNCRALRVLIVDDVPQVRQELRGLLQLTSELEVVGEAANGLEAISQAEALRPDVVVMDIDKASRFKTLMSAIVVVRQSI